MEPGSDHGAAASRAFQLNAAQGQRDGQIEDVQQSAEYQDVLQQEADLTAGRGILRTTGLIAIRRPIQKNSGAVATIEQAEI